MDDSKKSPVSNTSSFRNRYSMRNERGASVSSRMKHQGGDARPTYVPFLTRGSARKASSISALLEIENLFTLYIYMSLECACPLCTKMR